MIARRGWVGPWGWAVLSAVSRVAALRRTAWSIAVCLIALPVLADEPRVSVSLDQGWRFQQSGAVTGPENRGFDDSSWQAVDVPHTWNRIGNAGTERSPLSNSVQGIGWYRLRFAGPPDERAEPLLSRV